MILVEDFDAGCLGFRGPMVSSFVVARVTLVPTTVACDVEPGIAQVLQTSGVEGRVLSPCLIDNKIETYGISSRRIELKTPEPNPATSGHHTSV